MSAATSSLPHPRTRRTARRVGLLSLGGILLLLIVAAAWVYFQARSALPQLDGTLTLPGLAAPVTVTRDARGFPTIEAANLQDLFFAQGFVTAQDRLWQMDSMSRFAAGELSEILGDSFVEHDRQQRILGLRLAARRSAELLSAEDHARFDAYARGVNAYINASRNHLPLEFRLLHYKPRPWTVEDSMLIAAQMVEDLNHGPYRDALSREKILAKLGPELTDDLYVNSSWHDRPPTVPRAEGDDQDDENNNDDDGQPDPVVDRSPTRQNLVSLPANRALPTATDSEDGRFVTGSNNWVVSGAHTVSHLPLLSNDMHLGHQMPNLWYAAHLRSGDFDVAGVTLPGLPYVIVGHNRRIAWGFTNIGPTVEDVYVESFNPAGQYLTPEGWKQPEHRRETIHVKNKPDVFENVISTRHGPIITSLVPGETRQLALRWTLYSGMHNPFFAVNSAQNWTEFRQAFSNLDEPGQNVVYADTAGNIGYQATGKIPIRASGDGSLPENGSDNAPRMDRLHSIRKAAVDLQSAIGNYCHREQPHHS